MNTEGSVVMTDGTEITGPPKDLPSGRSDPNEAGKVEAPAPLAKPLVFISHKLSDHKLAEQIRDWIKARAGGKLEFFISSDGFGGNALASRTLTDKIRASAADASVMLVLCTSIDQDWNYVMLEMGVAMDPANPLTTVVALDCGYELSPLQNVVYVKGYDRNSLRHFCRQFLTTPFFPVHDGLCVSEDSSESYIDGAAAELASRIWKHLPYQPSDDFTVEPQPMLKLVVPLDAVTEPALTDGTAARRLLADSERLKSAIEQNAKVSGSQITGFLLFGMADFPEMSLGDLIQKAGDRKWADRVLSDIADGMNNRVNPARPPTLAAKNNRDYYPTLVRLSRRGGLGLVICELCFIRAKEGDDE
jgi:hypothetical protein